MTEEKPTASDAAAKGGTASAGKKSAAPAGAKKAAKPAKPPKAGKPGRGAAILAIFALLLALAAGGGAGYLWTEQEKLKGEQAALAARQAGAIDKEQFASLQRPAFDSSQIETNVSGLAEKIEGVDVKLAAAQRESAEVRLVTQGDIDRLAQENADLMQRVVEIGRTNRDDWRLAEVEYLLRLAHQRVVMGGELDSAEALLVDADNVMFELNMAGLLHVRRQVARDLAAVRAASELDVTGVYLELSAMQEQVAALPFKGVSKSLAVAEGAAAEAPADEAESTDQDWLDSAGDAWDKAAANFRQYVVVQKPDDNPLPLLTAGGQELVRVRLSLQLEQAKNALLLRQGDVFNDALSEASKLVAVNFVPEDSVTVAIAEGLAGLQGVDIAPDLPDISASQQAIRGFIDKTYQRRGQLDPIAEEEAAGGSEAQEVTP